MENKQALYCTLRPSNILLNTVIIASITQHIAALEISTAPYPKHNSTNEKVKRDVVPRQNRPDSYTSQTFHFGGSTL